MQPSLKNLARLLGHVRELSHLTNVLLGDLSNIISMAM